MDVISVKDVSFTYDKSSNVETRALNDISFSVKEWECLCVIGHTGSGKSTLVQLLNGLLAPTEGEILFEGKNFLNSKEDRRSLRFKAGIVFQYPEYQLFEETVEKDIAFGPKNMGLCEEEIKTRVINAVKSVGLSLDILNKSPFEISGGQTRRVAIAGVIAMDPRVLILDEPTAGLDPKGSRDILNMLKRYHQSKRNTIIVITHNMEEAAEFADRILVLNEGRVLSLGDVKSTFKMGDQLKEAGLNIPKINEVFLKLKSFGFDLNDNVYTVEQAVDEIKSYLKRRDEL